ncbi:MAG: helix-turn-helix transcriptional regulator [Treponema sp.]|jgi:transcriptional regulator with XRE-family HTH domain|nr:helix-turn-helix transcriptional regulator [Treponema sp.]
MSFGKNLRIELYYHGLQLKEFAGKVGIAYPTLLTYVNTRQHIIPKADVALKIARALNTSVEFLVDGIEPDFSKIIPNYPTLEELRMLPPNIQKNITELIHNLSEKYKDQD